jgi:hypothetical protein
MGLHGNGPCLVGGLASIAPVHLFSAHLEETLVLRWTVGLWSVFQSFENFLFPVKSQLERRQGENQDSG